MMNQKPSNPITWVPSVYFAMGLPFVMLNMVSVLMFKGMGVSDTQITLWISLIMIPWTLKFLWSPFLELYKTKKFYVVMTQVLSGIGFGLLALSLHLPHFFAISVAVLSVIALSGATHDVATDGVYMSELDANKQSQFIGWQGAFYNTAKIFASGGLVYLAGVLVKHYGGVEGATGEVLYEANVRAWTMVMSIVCVVLILLALYHTKALPSGEKLDKESVSAKETWRKLVEVIADFFKKGHIIYYIAFIILYRLAEGLVAKVLPLFLKAERAVGGMGLNEEQIGTYYGTFGVAAFVIGSILAGYYISKVGLKRSLMLLCCFYNIPFIAYALLAFFQPENMLFTAGALVLEFFGYGFGFVGLTLFMMQQIAPGKHPMAHYAFASGIMNFGVMLPGSVSGYLSDRYGYENFFIMVLIATVPAFLITYFIPFKNENRQTK